MENNHDLLSGPIEFALKEIIEKYEKQDTSVNSILYAVLKRSEIVWNKIKIHGLDVYGLTYDEFCKQCDGKPNIVFLSDEELNNLDKGLEIMKMLREYMKD